MRNRVGLVLFLGVLAGGSGVAAEGQTGAQLMRKNYDALLDLQELVIDPEKFRDVANKARIEKDLDALSAFSASHATAATGDPGLDAIAGYFAEHVTGLKRGFQAGRRDPILRNRIKAMGALCMGCHTTDRFARSYEEGAKKIESMGVTRLQRAQLYGATRQYGRALEVMDPLLSDPPEVHGMGYLELAEAIRQVLLITVRVQEDPAATVKRLERLAARTDLPEFYRQYVSLWLKDAKEWKNEKRIGKGASAQALMAEARRMLERGLGRKAFTNDPGGEIFFLRAAGYAHGALRKKPAAKFRAEALLILGSAYEALAYPMLWGLDELYYEACIRGYPKSPTGRKCFKRLADKVYFAGDGERLYIPEMDARKLEELRTLVEKK